MDNFNRFRISTNFIFAKIVCALFILLISFQLVNDILTHSIDLSKFAGFSIIIAILSFIFYFLSTRKRIDYDDVNQILYVVDTRNQTETVIPVEKIDKILFSAVGVKGNNSYVIVYRDSHNAQQKIRLFPIMFDNSINGLQTDAQLKNPHLVIRNWTFGLNELFD